MSHKEITDKFLADGWELIFSLQVQREADGVRAEPCPLPGSQRGADPTSTHMERTARAVAPAPAALLPLLTGFQLKCKQKKSTFIDKNSSMRMEKNADFCQ